VKPSLSLWQLEISPSGRAQHQDLGIAASRDVGSILVRVLFIVFFPKDMVSQHISAFSSDPLP
jgi:hypothetical protein